VTNDPLALRGVDGRTVVIEGKPISSPNKGWPADKVERRSVAKLVPYARNARTHSPEQVDQIAASIREWGWTNPVLVDEEGGIIAGHGRVLAAKKLGLADVPCMVARGWSDAQRKAYVLADNKLALNAGWDDVALGLELGELQALNFDLGLTGFSLAEIGVLTADRTEGLADPDDTPDVPADPVSAFGDVWLLGSKHRLVCGDSTAPESVDKALNCVKPHLMVTDPPYGVNYDPNWRNKAAINRAAGRARRDRCKGGKRRRARQPPQPAGFGEDHLGGAHHRRDHKPRAASRVRRPARALRSRRVVSASLSTIIHLHLY
jgi:ParB-like chromosome segregation protein Spo0J